MKKKNSAHREECKKLKYVVRTYEKKQALERELAVSELPETFLKKKFVYDKFFSGPQCVQYAEWDIRKFHFETSDPFGRVDVSKNGSEVATLWFQDTRSYKDMARITAGWLKDHPDFDECPLTKDLIGERAYHNARKKLGLEAQFINLTSKNLKIYNSQGEIVDELPSVLARGGMASPPREEVENLFFIVHPREKQIMSDRKDLILASAEDLSQVLGYKVDRVIGYRPLRW